MTKEELTKENGALRDSVQTWSNKDSTLRKRFATVFGNTSFKYGQSSPQDMSWEEIFCEIGKLIVRPKNEHIFKIASEFVRDSLGIKTKASTPDSDERLQQIKSLME